MNHIPDKYEHLVRYYGYYSNRSRGARRLAKQDDHTPLSVIERILNHLSVWDPQPETPSTAGIQLSDEAKRPARPQNHAATISAPQATCSLRLHTKIQRPFSVTQASTKR